MQSRSVVMARRSARRSTRKSPARSAGRSAAAAPASDRDKIIAAFLDLLAAKPIEQIGFAELAEAAGVPLAQLRNEFPSTLAILAAHIKSLDRALARGQRFAGLLDDLCRIPARLCQLRPRRWRGDSTEDTAAAA